MEIFAQGSKYHCLNRSEKCKCVRIKSVFVYIGNMLVCLADLYFAISTHCGISVHCLDSLFLFFGVIIPKVMLVSRFLLDFQISFLLFLAGILLFWFFLLLLILFICFGFLLILGFLNFYSLVLLSLVNHPLSTRRLQCHLSFCLSSPFPLHPFVSLYGHIPGGRSWMPWG